MFTKESQGNRKRFLRVGGVSSALKPETGRPRDSTKRGNAREKLEGGQIETPKEKPPIETVILSGKKGTQGEEGPKEGIKKATHPKKRPTVRREDQKQRIKRKTPRDQWKKQTNFQRTFVGFTIYRRPRSHESQ